MKMTIVGRRICDGPSETLRTENPTVDPLAQPDNLVDRTFLMPPKEDGTPVRAKIIKRVNEYKDGCWMTQTEPPRSRKIPLHSE
jgi:hypothetical protein